MSKYNNVNPGQYKVGGRLHPGDEANQANDRQTMAQNKKQQTGGAPAGATRSKSAAPRARKTTGK